MHFFPSWLTGYASPKKFAQGLKDAPAPQWGLYALLLRGGLNSLLLYLPLALMGRTPPTPSYLTFLPTDKYYMVLVLLAPIVFLTQWLLGGSVIHLALRLGKIPSDIDAILNLTGMASLVVGGFLLLWDWIWLAAGIGNQYLLGISHLVIDIWGVLLIVTGLQKLLDVPVLQGILLTLLSTLSAMPLAVMFMRSPL